MSWHTSNLNKADYDTNYYSSLIVFYIEYFEIS